MKNNERPLCVDLDGTLIRGSLMMESIKMVLRKSPTSVFSLAGWLFHGRAYFKSQLARRVALDPKTLTFNQPVLSFLQEQKKLGRKVVLATAANVSQAKQVAEELALFDEVIGSDDRINLKGPVKAMELETRYGPRGFDYLGNGRADVAVWKKSNRALIVSN
jgi:phosphoserine phosphatase